MGLNGWGGGLRATAGACVADTWLSYHSECPSVLTRVGVIGCPPALAAAAKVPAAAVGAGAGVKGGGGAGVAAPVLLGAVDRSGVWSLGGWLLRPGLAKGVATVDDSSDALTSSSTSGSACAKH